MVTEQTRNWMRSLVERVKTLLARPKEAWPEIDRDMTSSGELFTRYAMPLAVLAPAIGFITGHAFGWNPFGLRIIGQLFTAVSGYALTLGSLLLLSFIAAKLAPRHGGQGSPRDAFKLIVYSSTAMWLGSAAAMIPGLGFLGLASLYSLYLFFTGIGPIMKVPEENKGRFGVAMIACAMGLSLATSAISHGPMRFWDGPHDLDFDRSSFAQRGEEVRFNEQEWRKLGQDIRESMRQGNVHAIAPSELEALLPASIGAYARTSVESEKDGPFASHAEATYEHDGQEFTLKIIDLARMARFRALIDVDKNVQNEDGYERIKMNDGLLVAEKWDNDDEEGSYQTTVAKRFLLEAKGEADNIGELKSAVASIDAGRLSTLGK